MQTSAQIEFNLTIGGISAIYSKDYQLMLLQQAKDMYEGKCLDQQYIISINSIEQRSYANLLRRDLDAKIRVYVVVEATVMRFDKYDTVSNMRVNKIIPKSKIGPNDLLECGNEYCRALIKLDDKLIGFNIGDTIPIKVGAALLKIQNPQVLINAYPFAPHRMDKVAYVIPKLSTNDQVSTKLIPLIESKIEQLSAANSVRKTYFTNMLYPFKKRAKTLIGKQQSVLKFLSEINQYEGKYVYIDQQADLANLNISVLEKKHLDENEIDLVDNPLAISVIAYTFAKYLNVICELSSTYLDESIFEQHQYLWELYENNRFD